MSKSAVAATTMGYLQWDNVKILSLVNSTFREVFTRRRYLCNATLLIYSRTQLEDVMTSRRLVENVQHLLVFVINRSENLTAGMSEDERITVLGLFAIDAIVEVATAVRLTSIGVVWYSILCSNNLTHAQEHLGEHHRARLLTIPRENLAGLRIVNVLPISAMRVAFETLLSMAPQIETIDLLKFLPRWMFPYEESSWSTRFCAQLEASHLEYIRNHCPHLRCLKGILVNRDAVAVLGSFKESFIYLTDVVFLHSNIQEHEFRNFLSSQPSLVNVRIEKFTSFWFPPPTSLYEIAGSTLVNVKKFDVFGAAPLQEMIESIPVPRVNFCQVTTLNKVVIDQWADYNFYEPFDFQRLKYRAVEAMDRWLSYMPWNAMHTLRCLYLSLITFNDHTLDLIRAVCPLLEHFRLNFCGFGSYRAFVTLSRMQKLTKLTFYSCRFFSASHGNTAFSIPQLRQLYLLIDYSDELQNYAKDIIANSPNLVRLKLIDVSVNPNAEFQESMWIHQLKQLRWLSTNVHRNIGHVTTFDVSLYPMLERLCIFPPDQAGTDDVDMVRATITGTDRQVVIINNSNVGPLFILIA